MKTLIDVVNFNADASCLFSDRWLKILGGGQGSKLYRWLNLYVNYAKKVVLGFPGATIADIATFNPEVLKLINQNPQIFEIILRPFAHDLALLRYPKGFDLNFDLGARVISKEFTNVTPFFLPPEFMITNAQIQRMSEIGVKCVFSNPSRFSSDISDRLPTEPYKLKGFDGVGMNCIPFDGALTKSYLWAIQHYDCGAWNAKINDSPKNFAFSWSDGESLFFLPEGLDREEQWLKGESLKINREHLASAEIIFSGENTLPKEKFHAYPIHSCLSWVKEFRMLGFVNRISRIESNIDTLSRVEKYLWLMAINSDIMSSIEKKSPIISLKSSVNDASPLLSHKIYRSERWFEGEDYLSYLEGGKFVNGVIGHSEQYTKMPHIIKMNARLNYLNKLI